MSNTTSVRLRGNAGCFFSVLEDGTAGPGADMSGDLKSWEFSPEKKSDSDLTFAEALGGLGSDWTLKLSSITSLAAGSMWRWLWDNAGKTFTFKLGPAGNAVASADKPHFVGKFKINAKPGMKLEAKATSEGAPFDHELTLDGDLDLDEGA